MSCGHNVRMSENEYMPDNVQTAQATSIVHGGQMVRLERANETAGQRMERIRVACGYETAADAARAMGTSVTSYQHHENGTRGITPKMAKVYAKHFNVQAGYLLYGVDTSAVPVDVPIVGVIDEGGCILDRISIASGLPKTTPAPPFVEGRLLALVVSCTDLHPAYRPGDCVFFDLLQEVHDHSLDGRECIVDLGGGEKVMRVIHRQFNGHFMLLAYNGIAPQIRRIAGATPILWVQRNAYPNVVDDLVMISS